RHLGSGDVHSIMSFADGAPTFKDTVLLAEDHVGHGMIPHARVHARCSGFGHTMEPPPVLAFHNSILKGVDGLPIMRMMTPTYRSKAPHAAEEGRIFFELRVDRTVESLDKWRTCRIDW